MAAFPGRGWRLLAWGKGKKVNGEWKIVNCQWWFTLFQCGCQVYQLPTAVNALCHHPEACRKTVVVKPDPVGLLIPSDFSTAADQLQSFFARASSSIDLYSSFNSLTASSFARYSLGKMLILFLKQSLIRSAAAS